MRITIVGLGTVGLANLAVLAADGAHEMVGYDKDAGRLAALMSGSYHFDEPAIKDIFASHKPLLTADEGLALRESEAFFIAVGTPSLADGRSDLTAFEEALAAIARHASKDAFVVIRSTVPVGTAERAISFLRGASERHFSVISMPEFLAEGSSWSDENMPARLVVGGSEEGIAFIRMLYGRQIAAGTPLIGMSNSSAELAKYAANAFLAMKISYINELARFAERKGADIEDVALALGADPRIGPAMLRPGIGFGGSCLPKDLASFLSQARDAREPLLLPQAAQRINKEQPRFFLRKMENSLGGLANRRIAVLGLAYKGGIDDIRDSLSLGFASSLLRRKAEAVCYDPSPLARADFRKALPKAIIADTLNECLAGADAAVILTDDHAFANLSEEKLVSLMKGRWLFDSRNLFPKGSFVRIAYVPLGRAPSGKP